MTSPIARASASLIVGAAALTFGMGIFGLMFWKAEVLVRLGLVGYFWYVLLLLLGFAAAIGLFALFRSYARYKGKVLNGTVELGGPAVVMFLVILLGFLLVPRPRERFDLTVFVHGEAGRNALVLRKRGKIFLDLGADRRSEAIGEKGEARFVGIPADHRDSSVSVSLDAEDYELVDQSDARVKLDSEAVYLTVRPKILPLQGKVLDSRSRPLAGAQIRIGGRSAVTDSDGRFNLQLPADLPERDQVLTITAPNHAPWRGQVAPGGNPLSVQLEPAS
jgi:hypothetical protein